MTRSKILIVEDETIVALDIKKTLENLDFEITNTVTNYNSALNSVRVNKPDLILMDINLGQKYDGIDTVKKIHAIEKIPVIYVTAFTDEQTIKRAIQTNPVSYLVKPFKRDELKSNILLGLYKISKENNDYKNIIDVDIGLGYYYNYKENRLLYKEMPIKLSNNENLLLRILIEANNKVVTFEELEERIWPNNEISDSTLRTLVYRLRSKLEHRLIETVQKVGCRLNKDNPMHAASS
ncbi:response regulator [Halarcobacter anaerophilus]|jgi:DNA-binding response OmpR family regulator|uniref:DNA-binding response regulator n=1 Tax=Halarcobacter anaerophilus TaxID=877500 RepID=A0A4V1LPS9_9BACT|nr:response regulator [Halarcobacter anaerophilus]QDF30177.1 two-component system response regulator [Halarcobacter anaerophilus]RXJ62258.1 DNA-binding response regulator [Halarcobacter anaerophilus]